MVISIPTYEVVIADELYFRVPRTNLETFVSVLIFNGLEFSVKLEKSVAVGQPVYDDEATQVNNMLKHTRPIDPERFVD